MDILILGVLGDILGFRNSHNKSSRMKFTRKKYGDSYIKEGKLVVLTDFYDFFGSGGVNKDISNLKYSINTLMMMATMKGLKNNKTDFKQGCLDEYTRVYNKIGEKNLKNIYFINNEYLNSLEKLNKNEKIHYNQIYNDSMVISIILPISLLLWKKEQRNKLIIEIINNISLTHKNITTYLSAITLGLFISYKKYNINIDTWGEKLTEYLISNEFDSIIKELKMYSTEFVLEKEDYITNWKEYLNSKLYKNRFNLIYKTHKIVSYERAHELFLLFNEYNAEEFIYGMKSDQAIIIAYDSLLSCEGSWEKMLLLGMIGITDNSVLGMLSGILFGLVYNSNNSINKEQYRNEPWVKKVISLGKELDFN